MKAIKLFSNSLKQTFTKPWFLLGSAGLDVGFLFVLGFIMSFIRIFIDYHVLNVYQVLAGRLQAIGAGTQAPSIVSMLFQDPALPSTVGVIFWLSVSTVIIYVLYGIFQATAWWLAIKKLGVKKKWKNYVANFYLINLRWFPILAFLWMLFAVIDVRAVTIEAATQQNVSRVFHWIVGIAAVLVVYAMTVSYARLIVLSPKVSFRGSWKQAFRKKQVMVIGAILALLFIVLNFFGGWLITVNSTAALVTIGIILLVLLFLKRITMTQVVLDGIRKQS